MAPNFAPFCSAFILDETSLLGVGEKRIDETGTQNVVDVVWCHANPTSSISYSVSVFHQPKSPKSHESVNWIMATQCVAIYVQR